MTEADNMKTRRDNVIISNLGGDGGSEEAATLYEEATMPLEQLLERYGYAPGAKKPLALARKDEKFQSPAIRAKKDTGKDTDNADSNEASSTKTSDEGIVMKLDTKLLNGHSENENNANLEKERADLLSKQSAQDTVVDSTTKDNVIQTSKRVAETCNSEAEARDSSKSTSTASGTNGTDEKPSSSTPEPAAAGSSSNSSSSVEAGSSVSEGPSSSGSAGASSNKFDDAGPGPSSSKSDVSQHYISWLL